MEENLLDHHIGPVRVPNRLVCCVFRAHVVDCLFFGLGNHVGPRRPHRLPAIRPAWGIRWRSGRPLRPQGCMHCRRHGRRDCFGRLRPVAVPVRSATVDGVRGAAGPRYRRGLPAASLHGSDPAIRTRRGSSASKWPRANGCLRFLHPGSRARRRPVRSLFASSGADLRPRGRVFLPVPSWRWRRFHL